jgi:D-inositol-3-phosphate glycosyltransferase
MRRLAVLSLHTSPLAQPGTGDGGGMNVYVRELSSALARAGAVCDVFTRAWDDALPAMVNIEPGLRVHHVSAGPPRPMPKEALPGVIDEFAEAVLKRMQTSEGFGTDEDLPFDAVHANYWLSGVAGHTIKHQLNLPLVSTFHTLDRVKAEASPEEVEADSPHQRAEAEATTIRPQARRALGLPPEGPLLLFVGRIQPLKGASVAIRTLAALGPDHGDARLVVVGGPSGPHGEAEVEGLVELTHELGVGRQVDFVPPRPHELLSTYYRAADVCLVPSRSESFGLVALEAAACGTPVVASDVGGLRSLVDHGRTGYLVDDPTADAFAAWVRQILAEPVLGERLGIGAVLRARRYTWARAAHLLREIYAELTVGRLVECP